MEQLEVLLPDTLRHVDVVLLVEVEVPRVLSTGHHGNHRGGQLPLINVLPAGLGKIAAKNVCLIFSSPCHIGAVEYL